MNKHSTLMYFLDTEFVEQHDHLDMISLAMVCADGREFYACNAEVDLSKADPWVIANVVPHLPVRTDPRWMSKPDMAKALRAFIDAGTEPPEVWAYSPTTTGFCWALGGRMVDIPKGWPMYCRDLKQSMDERGIHKSSLPKLSKSKEHDALEDARWLKAAHAVVYA